MVCRLVMWAAVSSSWVMLVVVWMLMVVLWGVGSWQFVVQLLFWVLFISCCRFWIVFCSWWFIVFGLVVC